jgi:adenylate cyclase
VTVARLHTFLFADICGFSLLTELDGDGAAADVAIHLVSEASRIGGDYGAEVVKGIGDAVMVHAEDAAGSIRLGLDLLAQFGDDPALPPIHAGVHTGPALRRADDWWGATVNIAARVAGSANAGQLLVTEATRIAAGRMTSTSLRALEPRRFKNIPLPVPVYEASWGRHRHGDSKRGVAPSLCATPRACAESVPLEPARERSGPVPTYARLAPRRALDLVTVPGVHGAARPRG